MKIVSLVGTRPNFIKIASFSKAIEKHNLTHQNKIVHVLVHSGQHYDINMSKKLFKELNIQEPDINLEIGSGTHAEQVGRTMISFEKVLQKEKPDWVVVVGDVNATMAGSITAKKLNINCAHIEAGMRSGDMTMPEEINRIVTDRISDLLFVPDKISFENLLKEGVMQSKVKLVGNIMVDILQISKDKASKLNVRSIINNNIITSNKDSFTNESYVLVTLHRASNVDNQIDLERLIHFFINDISTKHQVVWPIHPRTEKQLKSFRLWDTVMNESNLFVLKPLGYYEFLRLNMGAKVLFTDSGGVQVEASFLGTPCLVIRDNTEWEVSLVENGGQNILSGCEILNIRNAFKSLLKINRKSIMIEFWDGYTAERIVKELIDAENNYKS